MPKYVESLFTIYRCKYFDPKYIFLLQSAFFACNSMSVITIVFGDVKFILLQHSLNRLP